MPSQKVKLWLAESSLQEAVLELMNLFGVAFSSVCFFTEIHADEETSCFGGEVLWGLTNRWDHE